MSKLSTWNLLLIVAYYNFYYLWAIKNIETEQNISKMTLGKSLMFMDVSIKYMGQETE